MPTAPNPGINYGPNVPRLPGWAEAMLTGYLTEAGTDRCYINSTTRTVDQQVSAMYDNEKAGNHIRYASGGMQVIALINQMGFALPKQQVVAAGAALMRRLIAEKKMASYHVAEACPPGLAAADISPRSVQSRYSRIIDVLTAAKKRGEIKELIYPPGDPALHVVFVQSKAKQILTAAEHLATGGDSATYEGEDDHDDAEVGGGAVAATLIGGGLLWYYLRKKRR